MGVQYPFKLGEPVWVRMDGFPWWPARIVTRDQIQLDPGEVFPDQQPDELLVEFFNDDKCFAAIPRRSIRPFRESRYRALNRHYNGKYLENVILAVTEADRYLTDWLNNGLPKVPAEPNPSPHPSADRTHHENHHHPPQPRPTTPNPRGVKRRRRGPATSATSSPISQRRKKSPRVSSTQVHAVDLVHVAAKHHSDSEPQYPSHKPPFPLQQSPARSPPSTSPSRRLAADPGSSRPARRAVAQVAKSNGGRAAAAALNSMETPNRGSINTERIAPPVTPDAWNGRHTERSKAAMAANGFQPVVGTVIEHVPTEVPPSEPRHPVESGKRGEEVAAVTEGEPVTGRGIRKVESVYLGAEGKGSSSMAGHSAAELRRMVDNKEEVTQGLKKKIEELNSTIRQLQNRVRELEERQMGGHEKISKGIFLIQEGQDMLRKG